MINIFKPYYKELFANFSDRWGGVSRPPYHELNIALHVEDNPINVLKNREIIAKKFNFYIDNLIYMEQTHSDNIKIIDDTFINKIENCDGIITNKSNIPLMVMVADCIPVLIFDKEKKVIGAIHAGRNGTFKQITKKAINLMIKEFDSNPDDILVTLGPSIHSCCYEVGEDLADIAQKSFGENYIIKRDNRFYLDLQTLNFDQLKSVGVKEQNIEISPICTSCNKNYFSYRRDGVTGRFAGVIKLNG